MHEPTFVEELPGREEQLAVQGRERCRGNVGVLETGRRPSGGNMSFRSFATTVIDLPALLKDEGGGTRGVGEGEAVEVEVAGAACGLEFAEDGGCGGGGFVVPFVVF